MKDAAVFLFIILVLLILFAPNAIFSLVLSVNKWEQKYIPAIQIQYQPVSSPMP